MKSFVPLILIATMLFAPAGVRAQSNAADEAQTEPAEYPANVAPSGIATQDWQSGTEAIRAVASPIGTALPGYVYVGVGRRGAEAKLFLDTKYQRYAYDCPRGRCVGFAPELWSVLPADEQRRYVDGVLDALMQSYPDLGTYRVIMDGIGWASWDQAHGRVYRFNPPL